MKTFTDEEIAALAKKGSISTKDYMKLLLTAKEAIAAADSAAPTDATCEVLAEIRDILGVMAAKAEMQNPVATMAAPDVIVNIPKRGNFAATVTERDVGGYIKRVEFKEMA